MLESWQSLAKMPAARSPTHRINHRFPIPLSPNDTFCCGPLVACGCKHSLVRNCPTPSSLAAGIASVLALLEQQLCLTWPAGTAHT